MATAPSFDERKLQEALDAARRAYETVDLAATPARIPQDTGELVYLGGCVSVTVENNRICLNLPLGIGHYCLPLPISFPDGTAAEACIHLCTTFGIPTGLKLTITIAGHVVVQKTFLKC